MAIALLVIFAANKRNEVKRKGNILLIFLTVTLVFSMVAIGYLVIQNRQLQNQAVKPVPPVQNSAPTNNFPTPVSVSTPSLVPVVDPTANWETFKTKRFVFKYPPDWKVGQFKHFPDQYTLQPADSFVSESEKNSITISVSGHCLNTQCLTVFNLEEMVQFINVKIISQAVVDNVKAYKVSFPNGNVGYVFINGLDFFNINTDKYILEMDKILKTFKFL